MLHAFTVSYLIPYSEAKRLVNDGVAERLGDGACGVHIERITPAQALRYPTTCKRVSAAYALIPAQESPESYMIAATLVFWTTKSGAHRAGLKIAGAHLNALIQNEKGSRRATTLEEFSERAPDVGVTPPSPYAH